MIISVLISVMPAQETVDFLHERPDGCHPERSEGSRYKCAAVNLHEIVRFAQNDIDRFDVARCVRRDLSTLSKAGIHAGA